MQGKYSRSFQISTSNASCIDNFLTPSYVYVKFLIFQIKSLKSFCPILSTVPKCILKTFLIFKPNETEMYACLHLQWPSLPTVCSNSKPMKCHLTNTIQMCKCSSNDENVENLMALKLKKKN